jgi:hypothetical protein
MHLLAQAPCGGLHVVTVEPYAVDVNISRAPEEGARSPSWPNGLIIIIIIRW